MILLRLVLADSVVFNRCFGVSFNGATTYREMKDNFHQ